MARTPSEERSKARNYGRRRAVAAASQNAAAFREIGERLLGQLRSAGASAATVRVLADNLATMTDVRRRGGAVWAIVDTLEALEAAREGTLGSPLAVTPRRTGAPGAARSRKRARP